MMESKLGKLVLYGLAGYGFISLASKIDFDNKYIEKKGQLSSGIKYTMKMEPHNTPNSIMNNKYVIEFGDSIHVEDAFTDGVIGPFDINDKNGTRLLSTQQLQGHESDYSSVIADDNKRKEILERIVEVYQQQGVKVEVRDQ